MTDNNSHSDAELPLSPPSRPRRVKRHWTETVPSVFAVIISVISLWIAIDTENTNRQLVSEAAWPFVRIYNSAHDPDGRPMLSLNISNAGIGPAKIETLEVFWKGKPYRGAMDLLKACCGFGRSTGRSGGSPDTSHALSTSMAAGTVLRAGEAVPIIRYVPTADNAALYRALGAARGKITYRVCYCSVFDECWLSGGQNVHPPRVKTCPSPAVPYDE